MASGSDKMMIRSSIHTPRQFTGNPVGVFMPFGTAWNASVCAGLDNNDYQPKRRDNGRTEQLI